MAERLTKAGARNVFYGGSIFFFAIFVGLTAHSHWFMRTQSTDESTLSPAVARGKHVWERNSCINCHTLLGEGAYFAPSSAISGSAMAATRTRPAPARA